jgi:hypothetical protein
MLRPSLPGVQQKILSILYAHYVLACTSTFQSFRTSPSITQTHFRQLGHSKLAPAVIPNVVRHLSSTVPR